MLLEICPSIARNPDVPGFMQGKRCDKVGFTVITPVSLSLTLSLSLSFARVEGGGAISPPALQRPPKVFGEAR